MRYLLFIIAPIIVACNKDQTSPKEKPISVEWVNFFNNDIKSHYYISHLAMDKNDSILFSVFSCGDSCSIAGIQNSRIQNYSINDLLQDSFKSIDFDSTKKIWYNQNLVISYSKKAHGCEQWVVSDLSNPMKSTKYKIDKFGNLWEASSKGLKCFDGLKWTTYFQNNNFYTICLDQNYNLFISNLPEPDKKGIILKYDYKTWDTLIVCANKADWVPSMLFDRNNNLWVGVLSRNAIGIEFGGGLFKFNEGNIEHYHINNSGLPSNSVVDLAIDNFNNIWIGTYNGGLAKFKVDGTWKIYNHENTGMPVFQSVEHIAIDKKNNIWLALWWTGLAKLTEK